MLTPSTEEQERLQSSVAKATLSEAKQRAALTPAERERRLLEMKAAAAAHDERAAAQARLASAMAAAAEAEEETQRSVAPHFIQNLTGDVLNDVSVTERIRGKKHTNQRSTDASSFLKRG